MNEKDVVKDNRNRELIKNKDYDTLIKENELLVYFVLKKFYIRYEDMEDYKQIGFLALYKAALMFDIESDTSFSYYAISAISNNITAALNKYNKFSNNEISYNTKVRDRNSKEVEIETFLESPEDMDLDMAKNDFMRILNNAIDSLPDKYKNIAKLRYFENKTLRAIAEDENTTFQNIQVKLKKINTKLQNHLKRNGINADYF